MREENKRSKEKLARGEPAKIEGTGEGANYKPPEPRHLNDELVRYVVENTTVGQVSTMIANTAASTNNAGSFTSPNFRSSGFHSQNVEM